MIKIVTDKLTTLEVDVHEKLSELVKTDQRMKIVDAADHCGVSPSKVSKLVRKLGFENFKQYKTYYSGENVTQQPVKHSSEIERLTQFLADFDHALVEDFVSTFDQYQKIILFGLGPSFICAEYFAYKLATVSQKNITVAQSEGFAERIADDQTLLVVFSVTGQFSSFERLFANVKQQGTSIMLLLEEYVNIEDTNPDYVFHLSKYHQASDLKPYEKTRTSFFIFIEEVVSLLIRRQRGEIG
ncbi:MurR/RpiR family transcriptional regulator [Paenalkalicoccus suaedae]|uniref:MurR/RpiR family transcriptional regulator n=1 Tax=Paenalkalicoccus suaedae TaxID=2592382 RepID=A0A859FIA3_9BACI|nr:SIS domain-containing protein [Paenalkalicoccus suaedae]QKS72578.1 MurR/RpiR family transcriptional regulator [Paenalkalicoccus suaedae]